MLLVPMVPPPPPSPTPDSSLARTLARRAASARAPWGGGGSLGLSALAHGALVAGLLFATGVDSGGSRSAPPPSVLRLADARELLDLPPAPAEPVPEVEEVPEPTAELVEAPDALEPLPEEPSLDEVPVDDPLAELASLGRPAPRAVAAAEPEPVIEPDPPVSGVAGPPPSAPAEPLPEGPEELEGDSLPEVLEGPLPGYPASALRFRRHGTVRLRAVVDASGRVLEAAVLESSGHEALDEAALEAFRRWRFVPRRAEDPERRIVVKPFVFRLP